MSREEVIASIREDCGSLLPIIVLVQAGFTSATDCCCCADAKNYFVSGVGDMEAYDPDCLFADPFASFRGTKRFQENISNFSGIL